jgi:asparagine synthase (glutamine-hydrolysing)
VLDMVRDHLRSPAATSRGLWRRDYLDTLLAAPNAHMTPAGGNVLWDIAVLEMWLQQHGIS